MLDTPYPSGQFALLMPEAATAASDTAEQIRAAIAAAPVPWGSTTFKLTASLGLVAAERTWRPRRDLAARSRHGRHTMFHGGYHNAIGDTLKRRLGAKRPKGEYAPRRACGAPWLCGLESAGRIEYGQSRPPAVLAPFTIVGEMCHPVGMPFRKPQDPEMLPSALPGRPPERNRS